MSHAANEYVKHLRQAPNGAKITPAEKAVLSQLADDHNQDKGCAWPSVGNVASRACMTERHCHRLLRDLEAKGVIELNPRLRENGGRSSSEYRFPQIDPPFDAKAASHTAKRMRQQALMNAQRPVQTKLYPPDIGVRGGMTPMSGGDGHRGQGGCDTDVRGGMTRMSGGIDPLLEPPGESLPEPGLDPKDTPPNPPQAGDVENRSGGDQPEALAPPDAEPTLPFPGQLAFGDPGLDPALRGAARWVLAELGLTGRRLETCLITALLAACRQDRNTTLGAMARLAVGHWRTYLGDQDLMRFGPWRPMVFFGDGHWVSPKSWPYDQGKVDNARRANVGRR